MEVSEAIKNRHSVRSYQELALPADVVETLQAEITACNQESGLHIQLVTNEPEAFSGFMAHYGKFRGVSNYFALVGTKSESLHEAIGYYGERLVLKAQQLGLNTCWVALSFSKGKSKCVIDKGEKLVCVIALGYGTTQGVPHQSKPLESLILAEDSAALPTWFRQGMEAVLLAPTAVNQQKFLFTLSGDTVNVKATGGFYSNIDLGIVKYHFEAGSGRKL